jgi:hypothetical protein
VLPILPTISVLTTFVKVTSAFAVGRRDGPAEAGSLQGMPANVLHAGGVTKNGGNHSSRARVAHKCGEVGKPHNHGDEGRAEGADAFQGAWEGACLRACAYREKDACAHKGPRLAVVAWPHHHRPRRHPSLLDSFRCACQPLSHSTASPLQTIADRMKQIS